MYSCGKVVVHNRVVFVYQWETKTHMGQRTLPRPYRRDLDLLVIFSLLTLCAVPLYDDPVKQGQAKAIAGDPVGN